MFSFARKYANPQNPAQDPHAERNLARFVLSAQGMLVYASPEFLTLAALAPSEMGHRHASSIFDFTDKNTFLHDLASGPHEIVLHAGGKKHSLHFDWITNADNQKFLIGSMIRAAEKKQEAAPGTFDSFVKRIETGLFKNTLETAPSPAHGRRKTDHIPDLNPFFHLSGDIMAVLSYNGEIIQNNRQFARLFKDQDNFLTILHESDRPAVQSTIDSLNAQAPGAIIEFESRITTHDQQVKTIGWRAEKLDSYLYVMGQDLTPIQAQKSALIRRENQLTQAESIGRMGHWRWVVGNEQMEWSDQIYTIFGTAPDIFTPSLESMRAVINRSDLGRIDQAFQRAIIEQNDYDMEFSIATPGGETRFIRCEGRCALDDEGDVIALYGIMQDMTERFLYESALKEAKDAAERAYAAKTQFLANMSHELRTPLNAIIGFSEMMQRQLLGPIGTEKYMEYLGGIRESGEHLLDLISDILDMSKIEAGKYELDLEEISMEKLIHTAAHMMEGRALEAGVSIKIRPLPEERMIIVADRRAVMQILLNILSNAVKFTNEGGSVTIACTENGSGIAIQIIDTGIGIPPNKLVGITRPFEQVSTDYARAHQGSGLGLAITKELVEMHGGTLKIESEIGKGTSVTVRLPLDAYKARRQSAAAE